MSLSPRAKKSLVALTIFIWLGLSLGAFWYYQWRWQTQFVQQDQVAFFNGPEFTKLLTSVGHANQITLIHLGRDDCFCNRFNEPHRQAIQQAYGNKNIAFQALTLNSESDIATPSAALLDAQGKLVYFGPYSDSLLCSLGNGLIEPLLDQLLLGQHPEVVHTTGVGCFCKADLPEPQIPSKRELPIETKD